MKKAFYLFVFVLFTQTAITFAQGNKTNFNNNTQTSKQIQINTQTGYDWGDEGISDDDDDENEK